MPLDQRRVFQEANSVGIKQGVTIPTSTKLGCIAGASFTYDCRESDIEKFLLTRIKNASLFAHALNETVTTNFLTDHKVHFANPLTLREQDVLSWICHGYTYQGIAQKLLIGESTVRKHIQSILRKTRAQNTTHAVAIAIRWGLVRF